MAPFGPNLTEARVSDFKGSFDKCMLPETEPQPRPVPRPRPHPGFEQPPPRSRWLVVMPDVTCCPTLAEGTAAERLREPICVVRKTLVLSQEEVVKILYRNILTAWSDRHCNRLILRAKDIEIVEHLIIGGNRRTYNGLIVCNWLDLIKIDCHSLRVSLDVL